MTSEMQRRHQWEVRAAGKSQCRNCGIIMLLGDTRDAIWYGNCTKPTPPASHDAGEAVTADDASTPAWTSQSGQRIATLTAEVSRLTVELAEARAECDAVARELTLHRSGYAYRRQTESLEQCRKECERLREALRGMQNHLAANMDESSIHYAAVQVIGMGNAALSASGREGE